LNYLLKRELFVNNILKITALFVCVQAPLVAMNFGRFAAKTKHSAKSIKRCTVTVPKIECVTAPKIDCTNKTCSCIKKYDLSTDKALEYADHERRYVPTDKLDFAIKLFHNNPDVALNLIEVKNSLCHKVDDCYEKAANPPAGRCIKNGLLVSGLFILGDVALCTLTGGFNGYVPGFTMFVLSGFPMMIGAAITSLTQEEKIRLGLVKYHAYKETDRINYALTKATAKKEQL
jgi:hypothetical protein